MGTRSIAAVAALIIFALPALGQQDPAAQNMARQVMQTEIDADHADHTRWQYRSHYQKPGEDALFYVIETDSGAIKKKIRTDGRPLTPAELAAEDRKITEFVSSPSEQEKQRKSGREDDKRAEEMLRMMPDAFYWSIKSESPEATTLAFVPNPNFTPPSMEARVFAAMSGEIVLDKAQHRLKLMHGTLTNDVTFGWGLFGRMKKGGTFSVERHEVKPGVWLIVETHVHIEGKALLFKSISEQEDEVKSGFRLTPDAMTLQQAASELKSQPPETLARR
ncbi:hypothetical protein FTW19_00585 [Terriglobus albidus]|uniref:Uncharacterized protein n=1 Tax=Terriglobus albidus TaxID=1592106 RepID=A0A5B9E2U7_9BACT|nr:hypothetical protein [Terriglobus albidus]QEE26632.1 hypothetical protein FTW19_00585 [Terriglobus albidus]